MSDAIFDVIGMHAINYCRSKADCGGTAPKLIDHCVSAVFT